MKRTITLFLIVIFSLCMGFNASTASDDEIPFDVPEDKVTDSMREFWNEARKEYPGLVFVDPSEVDPTVPVIEINELDELSAIINALDTAWLYRKKPETASPSKDNPPAEQSVWEKYPGLPVVDPSEMDPSIPVIQIENEEDLKALMNGLSSTYIYRRESSARSPYGGAKPYVQSNSTGVNCYGYAGEFYWYISPGDIHFYRGSPFSVTSTIDEVAQWVQWDYNRDEFRACRSIASATSNVTSIEWRIALRIGKAYIYSNGAYIFVADFHFMKQTNTGKWAHKPGRLPSMLTNITNPSSANWPLLGEDSQGNIVIIAPNFYDSTTKYFAVKWIK